MNKAEFINEIALKTELSKADSAKAIDAVIETITEALSKRDTISFIGFGTFSTSERAARTAVRVPGTDRTVDLPATIVAKFKVGKALKEAVAKK